VPPPRTPVETGFGSGVERWASTVSEAAEPCLIVDEDGVIRAFSPACGDLLGVGKPVEAVGRPLVERLSLIDFTANAAVLEDSEAEKIPPLLAIRSRHLARGLIRLVPEPGHPPVTVDAVTTPLVDGDGIVGSLTFFAPVRY